MWRCFGVNKKYLYITLRVYAIIFPVIMFIALESINPASSAGLFNDIRAHIFSLLLSVFLLGLMSLAVYSIVGKVVISYGIVALVWLILYIINHFKFMITGGVLVPSDILLAGAATQMAGDDTIRITISFVLRILIFVASFIPLCFVTFDVKFLKRIIILPVVLLTFLVFFTGNFAMSRVFPAFGLLEGTVSERYRDHGLILGFYSEWVRMRNTETPDIHFSDFFIIQHTPPTNVQPNVIVIMSEAFVDPTLMYNLTFSQNPIPNFQRLSQEHLSGRVVVPVFGGGTAGTEFEFLSGLAHEFFGSRFYMPFENMARYFAREHTTALPWLFRNNGYRTIAVHPYYREFYNRHVIYPLIGFDEFITIEDMPSAPIRGDFISDEYFTNRIIEQIILAQEANEPLFLFGISMQNHWCFSPTKYEGLELNVVAESPKLNANQLGYVNSLLQGLFDADKQLGRLVEFVEGLDTPTIIVFFGDHQPILGQHEELIFQSLGFLTHQEEFLWDLEDRVKMFTTPYLVWANYDLNTEPWGDISTFFLGALVAQASGINLNYHYAYILAASEYFRAFTNELYLNPYNNFRAGGWRMAIYPHIMAFRSLWMTNVYGDISGLSQLISP